MNVNERAYTDATDSTGDTDGSSNLLAAAGIDRLLLLNENSDSALFSGKKFTSWDECEMFLNEWAKQQGFHLIKDRVTRDDGVIRRRTFICSHGRTYESNSSRNTATKKLNCPFSINVSCPKNKNPEGLVSINKINEDHNHPLNRSIIEFEESKKFTMEMIEDIKFMTIHCKFGVTSQRKFLEGKFPSHPIFSKDLYATIKKFRPNSKSLSNDAAQISNWLDNEKEKDSRWVVVRGWDDDNTLTYLFWMTPVQVENWQWFNNLLQNYPNAKTYLEFIYKTKMYWAHCYTKFKFTGGMIASSRVESVNGCLKRLLHNSNIPLCDLVAEIQRLLDLQDKENEYNFWRLSIPTIRHQKNSNFLFSKIDQILQHYLTPTMLKMHRDEMNQSLYYVAMLVERNCEVMEEELLTKNSDEASEIDLPQATLKQIISYVGLNNVKEIWAVSVDNQQIEYNTDEFVSSLCLFDQNNNDYCEERLTVLEQRIVYGKLHGVYKKALNKALQTTSKSEQLISLLQKFADDKNDDDEMDSEEFYQYDDTSDKENFDPSIPLLQNPKKRHGKGRPLDTKRFKSSCEISSSKTKTQRRCKKCGKVGHYQKNCKEQ
ncbi:unnamed protein product [Rhizophagus irregularis]|nr:unnamed protein product [Rhizophagus irregularis]